MLTTSSGRHSRSPRFPPVTYCTVRNGPPPVCSHAQFNHTAPLVPSFGLPRTTLEHSSTASPIAITPSTISTAAVTANEVHAARVPVSVRGGGILPCVQLGCVGVPSSCSLVGGPAVALTGPVKQGSTSTVGHPLRPPSSPTGEPVPPKTANGPGRPGPFVVIDVIAAGEPADGSDADALGEQLAVVGGVTEEQLARSWPA